MLTVKNLGKDGIYDLKAAALRQVFGSFTTGVTVVTTIDRQSRPRGLTANSFTSVSMEPPLVLVCIGQSAASHVEFCATDYFAINILSVTQQPLSKLFASKAADKFEQTTWRQECSGSPVLEGALAWIDCAVHEKITVGDHTILIGRVLDLGRAHGLPLGFFGGSYITFNFDQDAESFVQQPPVIGGIIEVDGRLLLCRDAEGAGWTVPTERHLGTHANRSQRLVKKCLALGASITPTFVYSLFTDDDGSLVIVYRCVADVHADVHADAQVDMREMTTARWFDIEQLPWQDINSSPIRTMLIRYLRERDDDRFGIYVESDEGGQVGMLAGAPVAFNRYQRGESH